MLKPDFFLARGYVFASVNYRLAPEQKHPTQAEDTAAAIAWLLDHAAENQRFAERFKQLDKNGDGKVSAEEFPGPLFKPMDKDGDGFVTPASRAKRLCPAGCSAGRTARSRVGNW